MFLMILKRYLKEQLKKAEGSAASSQEGLVAVPKQSLSRQVRLGHIYCYLEVRQVIKLRQLQKREETHHGKY